MSETHAQAPSSAASSGSRSSTIFKKSCAERLRKAVVEATLSCDWRALVNLVRQHRTKALRVDVEGWSVLIATVINVAPEDVYVIRELVKLGADPNEIYDDARPLSVAAGQNKAPAVCALLDVGARIDGRNGIGQNALMVACWMSCADTTRALVSRGADVWARCPQGFLPVHSVGGEDGANVKSGATMRALLTGIPDTDRKKLMEARSPNGNTPLSFACRNGKSHVAKALLEAGADPCSTGSVTRMCPLADAAVVGDVKIMKLLLAAGVAVDQQDGAEQTPLMLAAANGFTRAVRLLLAYGANVHLTAHSGGCAASFACTFGHFDTLRVLVKAGSRYLVPSCDPAPNSMLTRQDAMHGDLLSAGREQRRMIRERRKARRRKSGSAEHSGGRASDQAHKVRDIPWLSQNGGQLALPDMSVDMPDPTGGRIRLGRRDG